MRRYTIYECECGYRSLAPGLCRSHPYPCDGMGPEMKSVEVVAVDDFDRVKLKYRKRAQQAEHDRFFMKKERNQALSAASELVKALEFAVDPKHPRWLHDVLAKHVDLVKGEDTDLVHKQKRELAERIADGRVLSYVEVPYKEAIETLINSGYIKVTPDGLKATPEYKRFDDGSPAT